MASCGLWRCRGAEEALGIVRLLCSNTLNVRLCRLGPVFIRCTFWRLLGGEDSWLGGLTRELGSPGAPEASGGIWILVSCPVRYPFGGAVDSAAPAGQCQEGAKDRIHAPSDREPRARASPRVPSRGAGQARARPNALAGGCARAHPMGVAPERSGRGRSWDVSVRNP